MSNGSADNRFQGVKVVHLTSVHTPFDSRIFQKECRSLASAGFQVVLVAPHGRREVVDGVELLPVRKRPGRMGRVLMTAREVVALGAGEKADIYHLHDPELLLWAHGLGKQGKVVVYDMHEDLPLQVRSKSWIPGIFRPLVSRVAKFLERVLIRNLPVVMAETSYKKKRPWLRQSVDVLNYPRLDRLSGYGRDALSRSGSKIGYIGAVTDDRGSLTLLEAMHILGAKGIDVEFDCVGPISGEHRLEIESRISSYALEGVRLFGYLPPAEGWRVIAGCDIGVALLKPIPNYIESYPTKMFEYMGMGLPVIVSDFPLYRKIIDRCDCGIAVDPLDSAGVADAIAYLVENPRKAVEMGENGKKMAMSDFNWQSEESKLLEFYHDLLAKDRNSNPSRHGDSG